MTIQEWWNLLVQQTGETDWLQWIAVAAGVAEVLLAWADNIWLYPAGILGTVMTIYILFGAQLYAESVLNVYYAVASVYGWWYWSRKRDRPPVKPSYSNSREWGIAIAISALGTVGIWWVLHRYTPSTVPFWDAFVSATAWAGTWLLTRRKIENWIVLNVSNAVAVPLLVYKHLPLFAALTVFLFIVAVFGYFGWRKEIRSAISIS